MYVYTCVWCVCVSVCLCARACVRACVSEGHAQYCLIHIFQKAVLSVLVSGWFELILADISRVLNIPGKISVFSIW